jgi:hypothetical protein
VVAALSAEVVLVLLAAAAQVAVALVGRLAEMALLVL